MPAYMIVNIEVQDPKLLDEYRAKVPTLIQKHGGEYLVRGGNFVVVEGEWKPSRLVLFRFPDMAALQAFYSDPEYQPLKDLRERAAKTDMIFVEGV
jgi:uncharacterized protein (DUF1330 family)